MKYLSYDGLAHFKTLLKNALSGKSDTGHKHTKSEITDYKDYELPTASADTLGGVKVGAGLNINGGVLSATGGGTADSVDWSNVQNAPTKVSQFTNDAGYLTTVPSEYVTDTELKAKGYLTEHQDISNLATKDELHSHSNKNVLDNISQTTINNWNAKSDFSGSYNDLTNKPTIPTKVSELSNDSSYASESYVSNAIANAQLGGGDTEIDLSGYATKDELANKVDKVTGKSLIADSEITRLASVTNYDDTEIKNTLKSKADTSSIPTKVSQLSNDKGYLTSVPSEYITETELNAKGFLTSVPSEYVTDTELNNKGYLTEHQDISNLATKDELHSHSNKAVLDGITNAKITSWDNKSNFSGSYNDLSNKPTIPTVPTKVSSFTNDAGYLTSIPSEYVTESEMNDAISNLGGGTGNVSSDTINSIMVVDALPEIEVEGVLYLVKEVTEEIPTNLYDYETALLITGYPSLNSNIVKLSSSGTSKSTYLQVEPNATYKIEKIAGVTFDVATTATEPAENVELVQVSSYGTASECTITLGSTENYILIYYCKTTEDTLTEEDLRKSIVVTKVS